MDDNTILTFGSHKGKQLKDIPDSWFIFMYDRKKLSRKLLEYAAGRIPQIQRLEEKKKAGG